MIAAVTGVARGRLKREPETPRRSQRTARRRLRGVGAADACGCIVQGFARLNVMRTYPDPPFARTQRAALSPGLVRCRRLSACRRLRRISLSTLSLSALHPCARSQWRLVWHSRPPARFPSRGTSANQTVPSSDTDCRLQETVSRFSQRTRSAFVAVQVPCNSFSDASDG